MSIIIKGMEMPKEPFTGMLILIASNGCVYKHGEYQSNVEAIELPPHGRLIDADALSEHTVYIPMDGGHLPVIYASYLTSAPTIIEAEEVYGKYTDTAGNLHWTGTNSGEHIIPAERSKQ